MTLGVASCIVFANLAAQSPVVHRDDKTTCINSFSGFPKKMPSRPRLQYPIDLTGVTLEYVEFGCYGSCPAFTLTISKDTAVFQGRAYVRARGTQTAKLSSAQFNEFLR